MLKKLACFLILISSCLLIGCSNFIHKCELCAGKTFGVHQVDVPQGNILSNDRINKIKYGMTKSQIIYLLGNPVINNFFGNDKFIYVTFIQNPYSDPKHENLILEFKDDALVKITKQVFDKKNNKG